MQQMFSLTFTVYRTYQRSGFPMVHITIA